MKKTRFILMLTLAVSVLPALAQDAASSSPAAPKHARGGHGGSGVHEWGDPMRGALESLTPAERKQLIDARQKAMEAPELAEVKKNAEAARKEVMDAVKAAILKADPSLAPILEKAKEGGFKDITPEERQKLQDARKAAMQNPDVEKARTNAQPAEKAFRDALHAAMLKADPTLGPVLEKVEAAAKEKGPHAGKKKPTE